MHWRVELLAAAALLSIAAYLAYISIFGVNALYWDEWNWVPLVQGSISGHLSFAQLWAQHNEDRILFPNLIAIALARLTRWNEFTFYFFSAACLITTFGVIIYKYRHEIKRDPLWFIAVPLVVFTFAQSENTLWGFQIAWFLTLLCLVAAAALLTKAELNLSSFIGAAILGTIASYSLTQGLLAWPIGFILLFINGRSLRLKILWSVIGAAVISLFFVGYSFSQSQALPLATIFKYLGNTIQAYFITLGGVIPGIADFGDTANSDIVLELIGIFLTACACMVVISWFRSRRPGGARAFTVSLILIGIGFDALLIPSRLVNNLSGGLASRYITFTWPLLIGLYLAAITWWTESDRHRPQAVSFRAIMAFLVALQIFIGTDVGIAEGKSTETTRHISADVLANWRDTPANLVQPYLFPPSANYVDQYAPFLASNKMGVFSGSIATHLAKLGVVPSGQRGPLLPVPRSLRRWITTDPRAQKAWNVLSGVYYASDTLLRYAYGNSPNRTVDVVNWAAELDPSPNAALNPWAQPNSSVFIEQYDGFYQAWRFLLESPHYRDLPVPSKWRHYLELHPEALTAWKILSGLYWTRPDLQKAYSLRASKGLLSWAIDYGSVGFTEVPAIVLFRSTFVRMSHALE